MKLIDWWLYMCSYGASTYGSSCWVTERGEASTFFCELGVFSSSQIDTRLTSIEVIELPARLEAGVQWLVLD
jgi:hypothetical protein